MISNLTVEDLGHMSGVKETGRLLGSPGSLFLYSSDLLIFACAISGNVSILGVSLFRPPLS